MALRAIVKANHDTKAATLSIIDDVSGFSPVDDKGGALRDMAFPYEQLTLHDFLFRTLGVQPDGLEYFHFILLGFNQ